MRWETCRIGSCQRHKSCMYVPCRNPELPKEKPQMTYPDDVLEAAREAAIGAVNALHWGGLGVPETYRARTESGKNDHSAEVQSACIAIMAEREHWTDFAKEQVKRASEDGYRIGQLEGELKSAEEKFLNRAESLIAKGKDLPFKPSFGMLVIEWLREVAKEGK